jgi:murein DD-endopeptidase MepM/ murein hydrolase activator NlpD
MMEVLNVKKNTKSVLGGKGFYIALALSVAMVGAACYFAYTQTSDGISGEMKSSFSTPDEKKEMDAAEIQTDIPKMTLPPYTHQVIVDETEEVSEPVTESVTEVATESEEKPTESAEKNAEKTSKPKKKSFTMPIEGEILNEFSNGELVKSKTTGAWQTHNGVDIAAALGDVVVAAGSGTVSAVDNDPLWGIMVTIDHGNGIITRYSNLNEGVTVQV